MIARSRAVIRHTSAHSDADPCKAPLPRLPGASLKNYELRNTIVSSSIATGPDACGAQIIKIIKIFVERIVLLSWNS